MTDETIWQPRGWGPQPEANDRIRVFLTQGDFARGQRALPVVESWIGSFASGQRTDDWSLRA